MLKPIDDLPQTCTPSANSWRAAVHRSCIALVLLLGSAQHTAAQERYARSPEAPNWVAVKPKADPPSIFEPDSKLRLVGVTLLAGIPDGIAPGVSIHPGTNLVHIDLNVTGALSFGFRGGVTLDPFDWIVAPTLTVAGGYYGWADRPRISDTRIEFETAYLNIQPGIEVGRRSRFRMFLRGGYSHLWVNTDYRPSAFGNQAKSPTKLQINLVPSLALGVSAYL